MNDINLNLNAKLRSDSVFAQLTNEQIEQLEDWLFEEKLGYKEVIGKLEQEFGVKPSQTALGRFFRRIAGRRTEEWRIDTMAQCLETLAVEKGDGTLQAGLFALANMHAVRLMTEEKPSFREITAWLRAITSASIYETKRVELQETREKERLAEIVRKEKEAKENEAHARWSAEYSARSKAREAKRKATIATKAAAAEAEAARKALGETRAEKAVREKEGPMSNDQVPKIEARNSVLMATEKPVDLGGSSAADAGPSTFAAAAVVKEAGTPILAETPRAGTIDNPGGCSQSFGNEESTVKPLKTH